jgi:VanZ family protein
MISPRRAWSLAGAWALVIFALSSVPGRKLPAVHIFANSDKVAHLFIYAVLGLLCFAASRRTWNTRTAWLVLAASLLGLAYGITDELHQLYVPGRSADPLDVVADGIGALLGSLAAARAATRRSS